MVWRFPSRTFVDRCCNQRNKGLLSSVTISVSTRRSKTVCEAWLIRRDSVFFASKAVRYNKEWILPFQLVMFSLGDTFAIISSNKKIVFPCGEANIVPRICLYPKKLHLLLNNRLVAKKHK